MKKMKGLKTMIKKVFIPIVCMVFLLVTVVTAQAAENGALPVDDSGLWETVAELDNGTSIYDAELGNLHNVLYGNGRYLAIFNKGLAVSNDGVTWTQDSGWELIRNGAFVNGKFYIWGDYESYASPDDLYKTTWNYVMESIDGTAWSEKYKAARQLTNLDGITGFTYGDGTYILSRVSEIAYSRDNMESWQTIDLNVTNPGAHPPMFGDLAYGNSMFIARGAWTSGTYRLDHDDGYTWLNALSSTDGITWQPLLTRLPDAPMRGTQLKFIDNRFIASGGPSGVNQMMSSPDGLSWSNIHHGGGGPFAHSEQGYITAFRNGNIWHSSDLYHDFANITPSYRTSHWQFGITAGEDAYVLIFTLTGMYDTAYGTYVARLPYAKINQLPEITGDTIIPVSLGVPFAYTVETANFNPTNLRINVGITDSATDLTLPPGLRQTSSPAYNTPLAAYAPHFTGTATSEGEWSVMLYAYSDNEHLAAMRKATFQVGAADLPPAQYSLTVSATGQGTTDPAPGDYLYNEGTQVSLTAAPAAGWEFEKWVINGAFFSEPSVSVTMDTDKSAKAYFLLEEPDGSPPDTPDFDPRFTDRGEVAAVKDWTIQFSREVDTLAGIFVSTLDTDIDGKNRITGVAVAKDDTNPRLVLVKAPAGGYPGGDYYLFITPEVTAGGKALPQPIRMKFSVSEPPGDHPFAGGSGTAADPYQVGTARQLHEVRNYLDKHFIQVADLDLSHIVLSSEAWYDAAGGWMPLCVMGEWEPEVKFTGSYDGNGFEITNLYINRPDQSYVGLFASSENALFTQIKLINVDIYGRTRIGGLVGTMEGGMIEKSLVEGRVRSEHSWLGGLVGDNTGFITESRSSGSIVTGTGNYIGGLVGSNSYGGQIQDCFSTATVVGEADHADNVGGLVGTNSGIVERSHATGTVDTWSHAGGLIGSNNQNGIVRRSYATGNVVGKRHSIGGLVGHNNGEIEDCYATGCSRGSQQVGGLVGMLAGGSSVSNCYATGLVEGDAESLGGLIGNAWGEPNVTNSYWNSDTSNQSESAGGAGKSDATMKQQSTFVDWDFENTWQIDEGLNNFGTH